MNGSIGLNGMDNQERKTAGCPHSPRGVVVLLVVWYHVHSFRYNIYPSVSIHVFVPYCTH